MKLEGRSRIVIRDAADADIPAIVRIYAHHVLSGLASFEEVAPGEAEMAARKAAILAIGAPYLVAELDGRVAGYAYAGPYRARPAYRHTIEDSIYVSPDALGRGVGRALLAELIARCEAGPWRQMIAVIGDSANAGSIALHASLGFTAVGTFRSVGFKFGRWVDSVLMQRALGDGDGTLPGARDAEP
ncbi:GNAT family N-acetyltransferase [Hansschlegelia zhihuaiae]|uniref:N-acetyltransferase family protein n=1 Tax=Hansschlegelia zhihuaiae TaxID=405005 RepID=A0A4Q0MKT1_9HYPH|nr:GNAT family N-acetyltransferase [Hansschlegelia zhihuaiae]RXF74387.1 N-acetyltransferase family protein [Hansschlegelia zhihuaiae]